MITTISNTNWPKSAAQYDGFRPLSGDALFVQTNHEKWRVQRKRLAPAFSPHIIDAQYSSFAKHLTVSRSVDLNTIFLLLEVIHDP
jgi:cholesterol 24-hydroxylase